ncbi:unnamed protein product [Owenia fusiformis]|uniref:Uncharacterized protein n=1 Tax=Owenia fusiformis TaxID=6347 RepID=A0A8J1XXS3_OWEFU|nr:unnamed protein product [Owenia fusiformis]
MTEIMERTISSLPGILTGRMGLGSSNISSKSFQNFVKMVSEVKTKYEEDQLLKKEVSILKQRLAQPGISPGQMKEYLVRILYCHMMGYDISFAFIHAVKLAQQGSLSQKWAGYLMCGLLLHENHELVLLLVNTIQKDLRSSNVLENSIALNTICGLVNAEMIPPILPLVEDKLNHPKALVRKKAVMCLHKFLSKAPNQVQHIHGKFKKALCDKDPSVMWAALQIYHDLIKSDIESYRDIVSGLVSILRQVVERKLPPEWDYHSVPAPWLQIQLLKVLALLGANNKESSEEMYAILNEVLKRTEASHKIGLAVIYECLETITCIYPNDHLVNLASKCITKFIRAKNNNLKFLGLRGLTSIVRIKPTFAVENQDIVIECLDDPDSNICKQTLELLYRIGNPHNVRVICSKLMEHFSTQDETIKQNVANKVMTLAEKHAPTMEWYIQTMNSVLTAVPNSGSSQCLQNIISKLIAANQEVHLYAIGAYIELIQDTHVSPAILQLAAWVLGEYSGINNTIKVSSLIGLLWRHVLPTNQEDTVVYILSAIIKLVLRHEDTVAIVSGLVSEELLKDCRPSVKQAMKELHMLCQCPSAVATMVAMETNVDEMDYTLSFLDDYVSDCLEKGALPYNNTTNIHSRTSKSPSKMSESIFSGLNFKPYNDSGSARSISTPSMYRLGATSITSTNSDSDSGFIAKPEEPVLNLKGVKSIWSKEGTKSDTTQQTETNSSQSISNTTRSNTTRTKSRVEGTSPKQPVPEDIDKKKALTSALFMGVSANSTQSTLPVQQSSLTKPSPTEHHIQYINPADSKTRGFLSWQAEEDFPHNATFAQKATYMNSPSGIWNQINKDSSKTDEPNSEDYSPRSGHKMAAPDSVIGARSVSPPNDISSPQSAIDNDDMLDRECPLTMYDGRYNTAFDLQRSLLTDYVETPTEEINRDITGQSNSDITGHSNSDITGQSNSDSFYLHTQDDDESMYESRTFTNDSTVK